MISITRKFTFDAGHRVLGHEGKCKHLHGHTYHAEVTVTQANNGLDSLGRVVDFSVVKEIVGNFIDTYLDHATIVFYEDKVLRNFLAAENQKFYCLDQNPTAENIATHILKTSNFLLKNDNLICTSVKVHETPNCSAFVTLKEQE